jgi:hypothetical protein
MNALHRLRGAPELDLVRQSRPDPMHSSLPRYDFPGRIERGLLSM